MTIRTIMVCWIGLLTGTIVNAQHPDAMVTCHFADASFRDFADSLQDQSGVKIFYRQEWVDSIRVTINEDHISVRSAVERAVQKSRLQVSEWNNELILLPGESLLDSLPAFQRTHISPDHAGAEQNGMTSTEERYLTGRKADVIETIHIGKQGGLKTNGKCSILGRVLDQETGEPVSYATIYINETGNGIMADLNGYLSLALNPGKYNARFEFLGYEKKQYQLDVMSDGEFTIQLNKAVIQMKELLVHGDRQLSVKSKDPGVEKILMKTIKEVPMMMGERNILQVSTLLPGIVNTGEGSSGVNVRGGGSDQNAFYINQIPVYNTSHLFGFFPAFNSDIIRDFSIYKGYVPAQYGGRLSSVFDILTRRGNLKHFTAHGGISPITANLVVEGPILRDTCSFLLSGRSSYSDWILKQLQDPDIRKSSANFSDFAGGVHYDNQQSQLSLFAYHSYDHFRLSDLNEYNYANNGASFSYTHRYSNSFHGEYSLIASQYSFSTTDQQDIPKAYAHAYAMNHYEGRADFSAILKEKNKLDFGIGFLLYQLDRGTVEPYGPESILLPVPLGKEQSLESAVYGSDEIEVLPWLKINAGFRFALFTPLGPKTVFTYLPDAPTDPRYIVDSMTFRKNEIIRKYAEPDVRLAANLETDRNGSVKLSFNQMHQNIFQLNNTITIAPNTQWKLADYHLQPSRSNQVSLGVFRTLPLKGLETSVEVYYKTTSHYPEFKDGADFLGSPLVETIVLQGEQKAYGLEFFLKRSNRKLEGWLSYTYSRSKMQVDGPYAWDQINNGEIYPANFDIPHVFNGVANFHFSRRITLSSIITYQSGRPVTYPVNIYYVDGVPTLDYSSRNAYRIPNYFRTDLALTLEGNLRKDKFMHSSFSFNLYNVTGRDNAYSVYFKTEKGKINGYKYAVIGVPVFTLSWNFKLGNYAAE